MIWYHMIWYDMIWYNMIWYDMILYDMIWFDMIGYDMMCHNMIWYDIISYHIILYHIIAYHIISYYVILYCMYSKVLSSIWIYFLHPNGTIPFCKFDSYAERDLTQWPHLIQPNVQLTSNWLSLVSPCWFRYYFCSALPYCIKTIGSPNQTITCLWYTFMFQVQSFPTLCTSKLPCLNKQ